MPDRQDHLTFRGNLKSTRYGWLRLTPAYSVHLVRDLLVHASTDTFVLDPFCGTGTTALVCAERGVACQTSDINPFLLWLASTKSRPYSEAQLRESAELHRLVEASFVDPEAARWLPPLSNIEKWWAPQTLLSLSRGIARVRSLEHSAAPEALDLVKVSFCRALIACANVSFSHQSMSFTRSTTVADAREPTPLFRAATLNVLESARSPIAATPRVARCDARSADACFEPDSFTQVITSPPYPNRMSYVRELRPYLYFLGYLSDAPSAGDLDWSAIGGTWGSATSRLARWRPAADDDVPYPDFTSLIGQIQERSPVLARYVHKYFCDMNRHIRSLTPLLKKHGSVHYIVGNSKFYEVMVPVERIFAALFEASGLTDARVAQIRKRTSKKELFEFVVSARRA